MTEINHQERGHSSIGASSASRWFNCPGSVKLIEQAPPQRSSKFAEEGTQAHELAEKLLLCFLTGEGPSYGKYTDEMLEHVKVYVDHVIDIKNQAPHAYLVVEEKFHNPSIDRDFYGTVDACIVDLINDEIHVFDLKYGAGIMVDAEENKQLMYYALGASKDELFFTYHFHIVQPRSPDDIKIKTWSCDGERMADFKADVIGAIARTKDPNASLATGEHCRFCPAITICPKYKEMTHAIACQDFAKELEVTPASLPDVKTLTLEEMKKILTLKPLFDNFCKRVQERITGDLMEGKQVDGFKLVEKRKTRKWSDEKTVVSYLNAEGFTDIWEQKLLSPSKIESLVGKKAFKDFSMLVDDSAGEPTLAFSEDKRPAIIPATAKQDFAQMIEHE